MFRSAVLSEKKLKADTEEEIWLTFIIISWFSLFSDNGFWLLFTCDCDMEHFWKISVSVRKQQAVLSQRERERFTLH